MTHDCSQNSQKQYQCGLNTATEHCPCSKQYWRDVGPILHAILANIGCQYWSNITM